MPGIRDIRFAPISLSATGDLVSAFTSGPRAQIVVINYAITNSVATAQAVTFRSSTGTNLTGAIGLPSSIGGGLSVDGSYDSPLFATNFGESLNLLLSASTAVAGHLAYYLNRS